MLRAVVRCSAAPRSSQRHIASSPAFTARLDGHRRVPVVGSTATAVRHFARRAPRDKAASVPATSAPAPAPAPAATPPPAAEDPWEEVTDQSTGQKYWWNKSTNETSALGAPKPGTDPWQEVRDPQTGQSYWWNKQTSQTTAVGAPKPVGDAMAAPGAAGMPAAQPQQGGMGSMLKDAMVSGIGHGVGFSLAGRMMDGIMGPRSMEVVHRHEGDGSGGASGADAGGAAPPPPGSDASGGGGDLGSQGWSWGDGGDQSSAGGGDGGWFGGNDQGDSGGGGGWFGGGDDEW